MTSLLITVKSAEPSDATQLRHIQLETWYDTYPNANYGVTLAGLKRRQEGVHGEKIEQRITFWQNYIASANGDHQVFMAFKGSKAIGYTAPAIIEGQRRLGALYVLPGHQGQGVGAKLLQRSLDWFGSDEDIYLHVAEYNQNAIAFYKRFGFDFTGKRFVEENPEDPESNIPELEMVRKASEVHSSNNI